MEQTTANQGIDEGVIKYDCDWELTSPLAEAAIQQLITWRDALYRLGLIGVTPDGIGFGNISQRIGQSEQFVITGTQTGHLPQLQPQHYTVVTQFDLEQNTLICRGPIKASSESLTHAAIYTHQPTVCGVIHVHHALLWKHLLFQVPTTQATVPYGTPQMAMEMFRLLDHAGLAESKMLAMAGHEDGLISFGADLSEAGEILLNYFRQVI